jgi:hypothetical protein
MAVYILTLPQTFVLEPGGSHPHKHCQSCGLPVVTMPPDGAALQYTTYMDACTIANHVQCKCNLRVNQNSITCDACSARTLPVFRSPLIYKDNYFEICAM